MFECVNVCVYIHMCAYVSMFVHVCMLSRVWTYNVAVQDWNILEYVHIFFLFVNCVCDFK